MKGLLGFAGLGVLACDREGGSQAIYPEAEPYEAAAGFVGTWRGRVGEYEGQLRVGELSQGRYFGNFAAADGRLELALLMDQSLVTSDAGATLPSNRALFTWQDGAGNRGHGWLKIASKGDALSGSSGELESIDGWAWQLSRVTN